MGCCRPTTSTPPRSRPPSGKTSSSNYQEKTILRIPGATAHLLEPGQEDPVELSSGDFSIACLTDGAEERPGASALATVVRVGDLHWPLTKDEPVAKVDDIHYVFSLPDEGGGFLNYGVAFGGGGARGNGLAALDSFLRENACFSTAAAPDGGTTANKPATTIGGGEFWRRYVMPGIEDYNGVLAKAVAGGTGKVVKGMFTYTDAYSKQVQKGANLLLPKAGNGVDGNTPAAPRKKPKGAISSSIRRVRQLSEMTEKMSRSLLNGVVTVSGAVTNPLAQSKAGKAVFGSFPGSVLLSSLDAVNKVLDAIEAAEKRTLAATGGAAGRVVSRRFGENAGQATEDVFATTGHVVGSAWNIFKIRKALTPSSSVPSSLVKNAVRNRKNS